MHTSVSIIFAFFLSTISLLLSCSFYKKIRVLVSMWKKRRVHFEIIRSRIKTIIFVPVMEELFFRYLLYSMIVPYGQETELQKVIFLIISSVFFSFCHLPKNGLEFSEKLCVGGMLYSAIYLICKDIFLLTLIHSIHNFGVLLIFEYEKEGKRNETEKSNIVSCKL